ncbi:MAG: hypothetical protein MI923_02215 [Phycisphaerales bacterium]|nr:hypothetical protein [Phycisphaerales bacterium]
MTFDPNELPVPDLGLRCLGCRYRLVGLSEHRCPECGSTFTMDDYIPPGDFPVVIFDGHETRLTPEVIDLMSRARIPFMEKRSDLESVLNLSRAPGRLAVPRSSYFHAISVLRGYALNHELPPMQDEPPDWVCKSCGESNPGHFEVCWSCSEASSKAT